MDNEEIKTKYEKEKIIKVLQTGYDHNPIEFRNWLKKSEDEVFTYLYFEYVDRYKANWNKDEFMNRCEMDGYEEEGSMILNNKVLQILIKYRDYAKTKEVDFEECLKELKK